MAGSIRVQFINNEGAGFSESLELDVGTTAEQLFVDQLGEDADPNAYLIRINKLPVSPDQVLQDGDKMSCLPTKVEGA